MRKHDTIPTFPVPGIIFERYYSFFEPLKANVEFTVHGLFHHDYSLMESSIIQDHLQKSFTIFKDRGILHPGFRAPYLRFKPSDLPLLKTIGFSYDGSLSIHYDILTKKNKSYEKALEYYSPVQKPPDNPDFPRYPVSLPDDEMLIDRLGMTNSTDLSDTWKKVMQTAIESHGLFILQLHPERFPITKEALVDLLSRAKELDIPILPLAKVKKPCICITGDIDALSMNDFRR
jgi:peptidoglycan/xylan/chitin deacetylase (PgdA/CDA1 family)